MLHKNYVVTKLANFSYGCKTLLKKSSPLVNCARQFDHGFSTRRFVNLADK